MIFFCIFSFNHSDVYVSPSQIILAFCWVYIRKFQSRQESEVVSTITAICALAIALITSALLPVDIFLVSFMKYPNGTYKVCITFSFATFLTQLSILHQLLRYNTKILWVSYAISLLLVTFCKSSLE